ncbi:DUF72 domain-containing protein [bacterium]|nr:DUF72 domain-containing protein [bacterium]
MMCWPQKLYAGTCSWKYDSWRGLVYSDKTDINYLEEYAGHYKSVEIDQWFWSLLDLHKIMLPNPANAENYARAVPGDFRFTIKIPNSISLTHFYRKKADDPLLPNPYFLSPDLFASFIDKIQPVIPKTGVLMLQFEYMNREKMPVESLFLDQLEAFAGRIQSPVPLGVEIRNPNYLKTEYFELLNRNHLVPVFLEGYHMPSVASVYGKNKMWISDHLVIRLLGPDRKRIETITGKKWDRIVAPRDKALEEISEITQELIKQGKTVYLNVNNHFEGSAPLTIDKIHKLIHCTSDGSSYSGY